MARPKRGSQKEARKNFACTYAKEFDCEEVFKTPHDASSHAILKHDVLALHKAKNGEFMCPLATECKCTATLPSQKQVEKHLKSDHPGKKFLCPLAKECQCAKAFLGPREARHHVNSEHRNGRYPCPLAEETGCMKTFGFAKSAKKHAESKHNNIKCPCPLAEEVSCTDMFSSKEGANRHANGKHRNIRYPCPVAEEEHCTATFHSADYAKKHAAILHTPGPHARFPCPCANEENCQKTFSTQGCANNHAKTLHKGRRYPCPLAEGEDCTRVFTSRQNAEEHVKNFHKGNRYPCPLAEGEDCARVFASRVRAKEHSKTHTHPFMCPRKGCAKRFATPEDLSKHENDLSHKVPSLFLCPLPDCRNAVTGFRLTKNGMDTHKGKHISNGDIEPDTEYVPRKVEGLRIHSDHALYSLILQRDGLVQDHLVQENDNRNSAEESPDDDDDDDEIDFEDVDIEGVSSSHANYEKQEWNELLCSPQEDQNMPIDATEVLSSTTRDKILEQNTTLWKRHKDLRVILGHLSHDCLGPSNGDSRHTCFEKCPNGVIIDFDNSRLRLEDSRLKLDSRCVTCRTAIKIEKLLARLEIQLDSGNDICGVQGCEQPSFRASGECSKHLLNRASENYRFGIAQELSVEKMRSLRETFQSAAQKKWKSLPSYDIVGRRISEIQQGKRPGSDLVILDDEFSAASRQLWEFAIIERISGTVLINTCVAYEDELDHESKSDNSFLSAMSRATAAKVYSPTRPANIDSLKADEIALRLQEAGITRETIVLVWHKTKFDLTLLREFLESAGHSGILPPNENCIQMIQFFRTNLSVGPPGYTSFPLSLEILFPTLYPRHSLIGLNHRALEDCRQTRLACIAYDELCKPLSKRSAEWQPDAVTNTSQKTLLGWVQEEPSADKAEESRKRSAPGQESEALRPKRKRVEKK